MSEPTATNPQTGEKIVFRGGQWVPMGAASAAPAAPTAPSAAPAQQPGPVYGAAPRVEQPTAIQIGNQQIAQEGLELRRRADERATQAASMGTEAERTAGFLSGRAKDAALRLAEAARRDPAAQNPTLGVEAVRGVFGDTAANYLTDSDRQQIRAAQIDIIDAGLTLGTGAAYTKEQLEGYREIYFPKLGDDEATIASKREALRSLLVNAQTKAGRAAPDIEEALAALDALGAPAQPAASNDGEQAGANPYANIIGEDGKPLGPDGGYGRDPETGEWGLYGRTTDDSQPTAAESFAQFQTEQFGPMGAIDLAGHGLTLGLSDEAAGVGNAIGSALTGDFDLQGNYTTGRDAERLRLDDARDRLGWAGTGMEILGGGGLGKVQGGINALMGAGRSVAARGAPVTRSAIQSQMVRNAGLEGAAVGGAGGFGYGEGLQGSATNALIGAATGGALGAGGQRIGNSLANRPAAQVAGGDVLQAADDLQIPVIPAVTGGTTARRLTGGARQGFISDRPISRAVDAMEQGGEAARDRAASQTGRVLDSEDAGNVVRQAANVYSKRTSQIGGNLYDRADRMAGGAQLPLPRAVQAADQWLAELGESVEGADAQLFKDIKALRDKMAAGEFSVRGIRQTRTTLREQIQERGLRGSATDKVMGEILQAATEDLYDGLASSGRGNAANALRTANDFWRKRVETIDTVLEPILGKNAPRSGEQVITAIEALASPRTGNAARLRQLFDAMPNEEARSLSATIISRMGQPTAGAAQTGGGFSFNTFLTNWNKMSPRARATMFPAETRSALDKLATVSQGVKAAGAATNTSNTAGAIGVQAVISAPVLWLGDPLTIVAATGGQWMVGRLLASPRVARWIAGAPSNPQARSAYIARLSGIARAEPALANEIGVFERALRAANDNGVGRIAAEDQPPQE